ncbi:MAG: membrane integrity-associated transporter subunit PqiC [Candidatus Brocadia sp.]|nr:membrane integrity-associated transporter subunit PqiC [Candidatus Brocadia sp.]
MKNYAVSFFPRFIIMGALAVIIGCASTPPSRFYILNSMEKQEAQQKGSDAMRHVTIGIGSIEIPDYLDRSQLVTRGSRSELKVDEFNRWAGSLRENISLVLAENLSLLLSTDRVFAHPWIPDDSVNYWIHVEIIRLDVIPGDAVTMKSRWTISDDHGKKEFITRASEFTEKASENSYCMMVEAMSRTFEKLSREIALEIEKVK